MKKYCAFLLITMMLLSSICVSMAEETLTGLKKFDDVVEVHIARFVDPTDTSLVNGDTVEDNYYTRYLLDNYNIKIVVDWTGSGEDYNQKTALSIVSGDIPDAFVTNYSYWKEAADAGLLKDISGIYEQYACDKIRYAYDVTDGRAMEACKLDGTMYGLANTVVQSDGTTVIFIRQDWLNAVGMSMPTTIDELYAVAVAFREAKLAGDRTIPILGANTGGSMYSSFTTSTNHWYGFDPILSAMGAYPGYFLINDGQVEYGSIAQATRDALKLLASWYAEGLIDVQLGTRTDSGEPMNANDVGMFCAPWWAVGYGNSSSFYNDENVDWQSCVLRNDNGLWAVKEPYLFGASYLCISADASDEVAAAALTAVNVMTTYETIMTSQTGEYINNWYPLRLVCDTPDIVEHEYSELMKVIAGEVNPESFRDEKTYVFLYADALAAQKLISGYIPGTQLSRKCFKISSENAEWQRLYSILIGDRCLASATPDYSAKSVIYNHTELSERYWDNLWNAEMETAFKIVTGQYDIDEFDAFTNRWLTEGGQEILNELQKEYGKK